MVEVFDEAARRREAFRSANGQFGRAPLTPPELTLPSPSPPAVVESMQQQAEIARESMTLALLDEIDATMPAEADFVNYEMHESGTHLVISEAIGDYGEELEKEPFAHVEEVLAQLGQPYLDFDGELVVSSVDDFGWERAQPYSPARDAQARRTGDVARARWRTAFIAQQRAVITAIWPLVDPAADALDFSWDQEARCMRLAAIIHPDGRTDADSDTWTRVNALSAYLTEPQLAPMLRNELSGLYRLTRGV